MKYRREIDGLRAVSVVAVVLYHARFTVDGTHIVQGGFLGVDIFFVISGFLITRLIVLENEAGHFSITNFYGRRARRILPALTCVLMATSLAASFVLSPTALQEFVGSVLSAILFCANFFFLFQDSYTAEPSQLKPLLHAWSLSVEEQFYLIFPPVILFLTKYGQKIRMKSLAIFAFVSLALSQYLSGQHFDANFFLPVTRAWELLLGSMLALLPGGRISEPKGLFRYMPTVGALMILAAVFSFDENTQHPSLLTLFPVLGCVFLIGWANRQDPATRLLSARPSVAVGLISYSLYLWHFPVLALLRVWNYGINDPVMISAGIVFSVILAALTWKWIEQPFRNYRLISARRFTFLIGVPLTGLLLYGALVCNRSVNITYGAIPSKFMASFEVFNPHGTEAGRCVDQADFLNEDTWCRLGEATAEVTFLLIGDSHAEAIAATLDAAARLDMSAGLLISRSGCPLLLGLEPARGEPLSAQCLELGQRVFEYVEANSIKRVIFASRWNYYTCGEPKPDCGYTQSTRFLEEDWAENIADRLNNLSAAINLNADKYTAAGSKVSFIAQVPHQKYDPKQVFNEYFSGAKQILAYRAAPIDEHRKFTADVREILNKTASRYHNISVSDPADVLCEEDGYCRFGDASSSYYSDDDHLSTGAATVLNDWALALVSVHKEVE